MTGMFGRSRLETRLELLEKRVEELEDLHRELRDLPVEWQDWLHKFKNVLSRLNQRATREEAAAPGARPINPAAARLLAGGQ